MAALRPMGYTLIEATDGQAGLEAADRHSPDLIITDLLMPTLDGLGLLRGLRDRGRHVPVIVLSAELEPSTRRLCEFWGAGAFLNKPFQAGELADLVRRLLPSTMLVS